MKKAAVYKWFTVAAALLAVAWTGCGGPTGGEENPELLVSPLELDFGETSTSIVLTIINSGGGTLLWNIDVPSEGWIDVSRREGNITNVPAPVDVTIDRDRAPSGQHEIIMVVTAEQGGRVEVTIKATIDRPAQLALTPLNLDFGETSSNRQVTLRNDGGETLNWNANAIQNWIEAAPANGSLEPDDQQVVTISILRDDLPSGSNQGTVDFTSDGGSESLVVVAVGTGGGEMSVSPTTLDFGSRNDRESVELRNIGDETVDWTLEVSAAWIDPKTTFGSLLISEDRTIFVEITREGLDPGTYNGTITFRWEGGETDLNVAMRVSDEPILSLSDESLQVGVQETFTFELSNAGSGTLNWEITETAAWLELSLVEGSITSIPRTITGTIGRAGMLEGTYETVIDVNSDGGNLDLSLTMRVPLPAPEITRGPEENETLSTDQVTFEFRAPNAVGTTEYQVKLDDAEWSAWSGETEASYQHLEESSLVGSHLFQLRVRADAGESEPLLRRFDVDAIQGPALRMSPKAVTTSRNETVDIDIVAEEVDVLLAAHIVLDFDAAKLELQSVTAGETFLEQYGGEVVMPEPGIDNAGGRLDLSVGVAGGSQAGVEGTGTLARLRFRAKTSGIAAISFGTGTSLRDLDNRPVSINTADIEVTIQ